RGHAVRRALAPRRRRRVGVAAYGSRARSGRGRLPRTARGLRRGGGLVAVATSSRPTDSMIATAVRRRVWVMAAVVVSVMVVVALVWRPWSGAGFVEHRMPQRTDIPAALAIAPDGAVWFTIEMSDAIGVLRDGRLERVSKG